MKFLGNINPRKSVAVDFTTATEQSRKLYWDDNNRTLSVEMGNGVAQQIGQEQYFYGRNNTSNLIPNGTVCMITGAVGESGRITIAPMVGDGSYNANLTIGITTENIATGEDGFITYIGAINGINTTGTSVGETWVAGDRLYVHPTIAGALTKFQPQAPNVKVIVGRVLYADATNGSIYVMINVGSYLGSDSNVEFTNLIDKNLLRYNASNKRWENISQADLDIIASQVDINDAGGYYSGTEVESALQQTGSELTELKKNLYNTMSTGALHFGGITKVDDTHFNVGSCYGYIIDNETDPENPTMTRVSYAGGNNLTTPYLTTSMQTQVFLKSDGTLYYTDLNPAPSNYVREMILLGRIIHSDKTVIRAVETGTFVASSVYSNLRDIWLALGPINSGVYVYPNGANLNLSLHGGGLFYGGLNIQNSRDQVNKLDIPSQTVLSFGYRTQLGDVIPDVTVVTPNYWDNNGVITQISGLYKQTTNQRVFLTRSGAIRIQYGQKVYSSFAEAVSGISTEQFVVAETLKFNAVLIGVITMEHNITSLNASTAIKFTSVSKFGELSGGGGSGGAVNAIDVAVSDAGGYYSGTNVETILQEIGYSLDNIVAANTKTIVSEGVAIDVANSYDSLTDTYTYTVSHEDTSTLTGKQGTAGVKSVTVDGLGHVTGVETETYLTSESSDYKTIIITDNDTGYTWAETGSIVATQTSDTVTFVSDGGVDLDVDSIAKAVRVAHSDTSNISPTFKSENTNGVVIQSATLTFDTYGHTQTASVSTYDLDNRYYTESETDTKLSSYQLTSQKGVADGYASLDSNGVVPQSQLPTIRTGITATLYSRVVLDSAVAQVAIGIPNFNKNTDVLMVYQNSTYLALNQDYTISNDSLNIFKSGGTWDSGTVIDFTVFMNTNVGVETLSVIFNSSSFTATVDNTTNCALNYNYYNPLKDRLLVYYKNLLLFEGVDYTVNINNISIDLIDFSINSGEILRYEIWKKIKYDGGTVDGSQITNGSIDYDKLNTDVQALIDKNASLTTTSTAQTMLATFSLSEFGSAKFMIQATRGTERQISELLVVHNGVTAYATEYGVVMTGTKVYDVDVDVSSGNVRVLVTSASTTSTAYKTKYELINV